MAWLWLQIGLWRNRPRGVNCQSHPAWDTALEQEWDFVGGKIPDWRKDARWRVLDLMSCSSPTVTNSHLYADTFNWTLFNRNPDLLLYRSLPQPASSPPQAEFCARKVQHRLAMQLRAVNCFTPPHPSMHSPAERCSAAALLSPQCCPGAGEACLHPSALEELWGGRR